MQNDGYSAIWDDNEQYYEEFSSRLEEEHGFNEAQVEQVSKLIQTGFSEAASISTVLQSR